MAAPSRSSCRFAGTGPRRLARCVGSSRWPKAGNGRSPMKKPRRSGAGARSTHLLDTSTLLWALGSPERLSARARHLVDAGENIISVASYWEVVIKTHKGLLTIADLPTWWRRATELTAAHVLPIRASHVTALAALPMLHKDRCMRNRLTDAFIAIVLGAAATVALAAQQPARQGGAAAPQPGAPTARTGRG